MIRASVSSVGVAASSSVPAAAPGTAPREKTPTNRRWVSVRLNQVLIGSFFPIAHRSGNRFQKGP